MRTRYTPEQVAQALSQARGMRNIAALSLRCHPSTVSRYVARYREVREALDLARGLFVDTAEQQLMRAVDNGDWPAVRFTLITLGKDRGYVIGDSSHDGRSSPDDGRQSAELEAALLKAYGPGLAEGSEDPLADEPWPDSFDEQPGDGDGQIKGDEYP